MLSVATSHPTTTSYSRKQHSSIRSLLAHVFWYHAMPQLYSGISAGTCHQHVGSKQIPKSRGNWTGKLSRVWRAAPLTRCRRYLGFHLCVFNLNQTLLLHMVSALNCIPKMSRAELAELFLAWTALSGSSLSRIMQRGVLGQKPLFIKCSSLPLWTRPPTCSINSSSCKMPMLSFTHPAKSASVMLVILS